MNSKAIGNRIRGLREELGQSKRFVAGQLGISYSSMCQYEYGLRIPGDETKLKIADYFGQSVESLFYAPDNNET